MLQFDNLSKNFGGLQVLHDVSFSVPRGGIFRADRTERRGQDDAIQPDQRLVASVVGEHRPSTDTLSRISPRTGSRD